jgi:hypothetical protein
LVVKGKKNIFIFGTNGNHMPYKKHDPWQNAVSAHWHIYLFEIEKV